MDELRKQIDNYHRRESYEGDDSRLKRSRNESEECGRTYSNCPPPPKYSDRNGAEGNSRHRASPVETPRTRIRRNMRDLIMRHLPAPEDDKKPVQKAPTIIVDKQKRLEISEILHKMNSSVTCGDGNVPVVAGIGEDPGVLELKDLPRDVIDQLRNMLGVDLEQLVQERQEVSASACGAPCIKKNEPICRKVDNGEKESQLDARLMEVKEEPDNEFVEPFHHPAAIQVEPSASDNNFSDTNNESANRESSPTFDAVATIEATIKTSIETDRNEPPPHYSSYEDLVNKIKGFERCGKLLEDYKNDLMEDLFHVVKKLDKNYNMHSNNAERRPSDALDAVSESVTDNSKKRCRKEETNGEEVKKIKLNGNANNEPAANLPDIKERVSVLKFNFVKYCLLIGTVTGEAHVLNMKTNRVTQTLRVDQGPVTSIMFQRKCWFIGTENKLLKLYHVTKSSANLAKEFQTHVMPNPVLCMISTRNKAIIGCKSGTIVRYNKAADKFIEIEHTSESRLDVIGLRAAGNEPSRILIVGQRCGPVVIMDLESMVYLRNFSGQQEVNFSTVRLIDFDYTRVFCGTKQNEILIYDEMVALLQHRLKVSEVSRGITCIKAAGSLLFAGCSNGNVYVYMLDRPELVNVLRGPGGVVNCIEVIQKQIVISTSSNKLSRIDFPSEVLAAIEAKKITFTRQAK